MPARGKRVELAPVDPEGLFEGILPRRKLPLALPARGPRRGRNDRAPRRPVRIPADARRPRSAPARGGPARAPLRQARRPPARARRRRRHRVRGLGAERALAERRRRLQRLGRPPQPDAVARRLGRVGALRPGRRAGQPLQVRAARAGGAARAEGRPGRLRRRAAPCDRLADPRPAPRLGGRRLARAAAGEAPARRAALDLRGPPRVVAAKPARGQPEPLLPRARRRARRLRRRPRLHPRRAAARDGAPVRGVVGLPGERLLRADLPARHARRVPRLRRPAPCGGPRRHPRLGAGALPAGRVRPGPLRRHRALRARGPAPRRASGLGNARVQLRPPRGAQLPASPTRSSGSGSTTRTACGSTRSRR